MQSELYQSLIEYAKSDYYGFHMPGHKRNTDLCCMDNPYSFDITEIDGFDNLHNPQGIIQKEMDRATRIYGSKQSYFLVNGSSCGILAAISSVAGPGDKIIIGRNCHKSVYNAVELLRLKCEYIFPEVIRDIDIFGKYVLEDLEEVLNSNSDAKAIVITSPTYEGVVSDIEGICEIAHKRGITVIVDSAHGAHFILSDRFPKSAVRCGADIIIESVHKTLPSLTQTAVLHYNSDIVEQRRLEKYLSVYQTSSPSYVLLSSICNCVSFIEVLKKDNNQQKLVTKYIELINQFAADIGELSNFRLLNKELCKGYDFDQGKFVIIIQNQNMTGHALKKILNSEYHIEVEMAARNYIIAMTSIFDTEQGFARLANALRDIDDMKRENRIAIPTHRSGLSESLQDIYSIRNYKKCEIFDANQYDDVEKEYIYLYPPGIPIIVPGEKVDDNVKKIICEYEEAGYEIIRQS